MMLQQETAILKLKYFKEYVYKSQTELNISNITVSDLESINRAKTELALKALQLYEFIKVVSQLDYAEFDYRTFLDSYNIGDSDIEFEQLEQLRELSGEALWLIDIEIDVACRREGYGKFVIGCMKRMGYPIVLFSNNSSHTYWLERGFEMVANNIYVWSGK